MGHPTLEASGVLPGTPGAQMATHSGIRADDDAHIHVCCPAVWAWMAVLLQFWQDHMTRHLYGGCFRQVSDLANTLIRDINVWTPYSTRFGWNYVATYASLWLDIWDRFAEEHLEEWEAQKSRAVALNYLERDTEAVYRARIIKKQDNKAHADSKEASAQELPPD